MRIENFSTIQHVPQGDRTIAVEVPDGSPWIKLPLGNEMLDADFQRQSHNLVVDTPQQKIVVENYFAGDSFPALLSETGKKIGGASVDNLAGPESPLQFAGPVAVEGNAIGTVEKLKGSVTVTRNGQQEQLEQGDAVFQNDVIETNGSGSIGITFEDGSVFTLGAEARMTLDEFVYDPATGDGSSSVNVLKGMFKFVSGEIAANNPGDMQVETPVATIGIRGTTGGGSVQGEGADNQFYLEPNADGTVGWFDVTTAQGTVPMNQPNTVVGLKSFNDAPPAPQFVAPEQIKQTFAQVVDFAPPGKYEARQNNNSDLQPQAQTQDPNSMQQAPDQQQNENSDAEAAEGEPKEEASAEETSDEATDEAGNEEATAEDGGEENAADATQESEQSAADSEVSANGEQSGEALESFSGNENFDGEAPDGESGEAPQEVEAQSNAEDAPEPDNQTNGADGSDAPAGDDPVTGDSTPEPTQEFIATGTASEGGTQQSGFQKASDMDSASNQNTVSSATETTNGTQTQSGTTATATTTAGTTTGETSPTGDSTQQSSGEQTNTTTTQTTTTTTANSFLQSQITAQETSLTETTSTTTTESQPLPPPPEETTTTTAEGTTPEEPTAPLEETTAEEAPPPPPALLTLTDAADSLSSSSQETVFEINADTVLSDFQAGNDTLDGGLGIDTLKFDALTGGYTIDMAGVEFANTTNIERFEFWDSGVTFKLDNTYANSFGDASIILAHNQAMTLDLNNYASGHVAVEGSTAVSVSGAASTNYFFSNENSTSIQLDFTANLGNNHVFLMGGSNSITAGTSGELLVYQEGGTNLSVDGGQTNADVILDNVSGATISTEGDTITGSYLDIANSSDVLLNLNGSGRNIVNLDNMTNVTVNGAIGTTNNFYLSGSHSGLNIQSSSNDDIYTFYDFSGNANITVHGNDSLYFDKLLGTSDFHISKSGAGSVTLDFLNLDFGNFNFSVLDVDGDTTFDDLKLEDLANGHSILLDGFFTGDNGYRIFTDHAQIDMTDVAFSNFARGAFHLNAQPADLERITIDGTDFIFKASPVSPTDILIGANVLETLENIVNTINSVGVGVIASHDNNGTVRLLTDTAGTLPALATSTAAVTIDDMAYNSYFQAMGTHDNPYEAWGSSALYITDTVKDDVIRAVEASQKIEGGIGNDTFYANAASVSLKGGVGNDHFVREVGAGASDITINGGSGDKDVLDYSLQSSNLTIDLNVLTVIDGTFTDSVAGVEIIYSGSGNDIIEGTDHLANTISGGAGADTIDGGLYSIDHEKNTVDYGASNAAVNIDLLGGSVSGGHAQGDVLTNITHVKGSAHNDVLIGDSGDNTLYGNAGLDTLTGGAGMDTLVGGTGDDSIDLESDGFRDHVKMAATGKDSIHGFEANLDILDLSELHRDTDGDHYFDLLANSKLQIQDTGAEIIIRYGSSLTEVARLEGLTGTTIDWKHILIGNGNHIASDADDGVSDGSLDGDSGADVMLSDTDGRTLSGYDGNDILSNNGNDNVQLFGGEGNDVLVIDDITSTYTLDGGLGEQDTLRLEDLMGGTLDLAAFTGANTLADIEIIDLNGFDLTQITDLEVASISGEHELFITGNGAETITLDTSIWELRTDAELPSHIEAESGYSTYIATSDTHGEVALHVNNNLTVN